MGFMGGLFKALGFESEKKTKSNKKQAKASYNFKKGDKNRIDQIDGVPVYYPENFGQLKDFVEFVKEGKAIIISKEATTKEDGQRILDFLQGYVDGAKGRLIVLEEEKLYLVLPEGMEIEE